MIIRITEDTRRLAFKIKHWPSQTYMQDWENLELVITPGEARHGLCKEPLSPWYAYGCFPMTRTGVDLNNPPAYRQDLPAFVIPAFEKDMDGRIVFILPDRWQETCYGRYTGMIRYTPKQELVPFNAQPGFDISYKEAPNGVPADMTSGLCNSRPNLEPAIMLAPPPRISCCVLIKFDIDFGRRCSEFITEQAAFELALDNSCGFED